ncbi:hypothetical protein EV2_032887 [Malus domestica]
MTSMTLPPNLNSSHVLLRDLPTSPAGDSQNPNDGGGADELLEDGGSEGHTGSGIIRITEHGTPDPVLLSSAATVK